jgi:hypothetical protein
MTRGLEGRRSVQLSYGRRIRTIGALGFEPRTSCSQSRRATELRHAPWEQDILAEKSGRVKDEAGSVSAVGPGRSGRMHRCV